jgi:hypothetical protein
MLHTDSENSVGRGTGRVISTTIISDSDFDFDSSISKSIVIGATAEEEEEEVATDTPVIQD